MPDENPYQPPNHASEGGPHGHPPGPDYGNLTPKQLGIIAWACIALACFDLVLTVLSIAAEVNPALEPINNIINIFYGIVSIYVLLAFNTFLTYCLHIQGTAKIIFPLIIFSIIYTIAPLVGGSDEESKQLTDSIFLVSLVPYGILIAMLGKKIQSSQFVYPHLNNIAWLHTAAGICTATLVLMLIAIPIFIAIDILMALMFFHAQKERLHSS